MCCAAHETKNDCWRRPAAIYEVCMYIIVMKFVGLVTKSVCEIMGNIPLLPKQKYQ